MCIQDGATLHVDDLNKSLWVSFSKISLIIMVLQCFECALVQLKDWYLNVPLTVMKTQVNWFVHNG